MGQSGKMATRGARHGSVRKDDDEGMGQSGEMTTRGRGRGLAFWAHMFFVVCNSLYGEKDKEHQASKEGQGKKEQRTDRKRNRRALGDAEEAGHEHRQVRHDTHAQRQHQRPQRRRGRGGKGWQ